MNEPALHLNIRDLADAAGVTVRTVHYYVSEGLLPSPHGEGRQAHYSAGHLARLKLIAALRDEGLSLAAIRARLAPLGDADAVSALAALEQHDVSSPAVTAVGLFEAAVSEQLSPPSSGTTQPTGATGVAEESAGEYVERILGSRPPATAPTQAPTRQEPLRPETWFTYRVADGIELSVRDDQHGGAGRHFDDVVDALRDLLRRHYGVEPDDQSL